MTNHYGIDTGALFTIAPYVGIIIALMWAGFNLWRLFRMEKL